MNYTINPKYEEKQLRTWGDWRNLYPQCACPGRYEYFFRILPNHSRVLHRRCVVCGEDGRSPMSPREFAIEWLKTLPVERVIPEAHEPIAPNTPQFSEKNGESYD